MRKRLYSPGLGDEEETAIGQDSEKTSREAHRTDLESPRGWFTQHAAGCAKMCCQEQPEPQQRA